MGPPRIRLLLRGWSAFRAFAFYRWRSRAFDAAPGWFRFVVRLRPHRAVGRLHSFHYLINGPNSAGVLDLPAFGPLSYLQPGVPSGTLSESIVRTSKIYDGMKSEYWIYVPAQYDPKFPAR